MKLQQYLLPGRK